VNGLNLKGFHVRCGLLKSIGYKSDETPASEGCPKEMLPSRRVYIPYSVMEGQGSKTYIALAEEVRDEEEVILHVKAATQLEVLSEGVDGRCLCQLLHTPRPSELVMRVLGG
jgi:hypothetical protein